MSIEEAKGKFKAWLIESLKGFISPKNTFHLIAYGFLLLKMSYNGGSIVYHTVSGFVQEVKENKSYMLELAKDFSNFKMQIHEDSIKQALIDRRQNDRIDKKADRLIAKQP